MGGRSRKSSGSSTSRPASRSRTQPRVLCEKGYRRASEPYRPDREGRHGAPDRRQCRPDPGRRGQVVGVCADLPRHDRTERCGRSAARSEQRFQSLFDSPTAQISGRPIRRAGRGGLTIGAHSPGRRIDEWRGWIWLDRHHPRRPGADGPDFGGGPTRQGLRDRIRVAGRQMDRYRWTAVRPLRCGLLIDISVSGSAEHRHQRGSRPQRTEGGRPPQERVPGDAGPRAPQPARPDP